MDLRKIRQLLAALESSAIRDLEWTEQGATVRIQRGSAATRGASATILGGSTARSGGLPVSAVPPPLRLVRAPCVGVVRLARTPGGPPLLKVGERVAVNRTLCLIRAMKLDHDVLNDADGVVHAVLFQDGQPVQYGDPLFEIED